MPPDKTSGRGYFSPDDPTGTEVSWDNSFVWATAWFLQCVFITLHFLHKKNTRNMTYIIGFSLETNGNKKISTWIDPCTLPVLFWLFDLHQSRWTDANGPTEYTLVTVITEVHVVAGMVKSNMLVGRWQILGCQVALEAQWTVVLNGWQCWPEVNPVWGGSHGWNKQPVFFLWPLFSDTNGSDNSIPMAYLTLDHQLQVPHPASLQQQQSYK